MVSEAEAGRTFAASTVLRDEEPGEELE